MAFQLFLIWDFIIGLLLGNGVPHFIFGAAGKIFRSPFGKKSKPKVNVFWGLSNFVLATIISAGVLVFQSIQRLFAYRLTAGILVDGVDVRSRLRNS